VQHVSGLTEFEKLERRKHRQLLVFNAAVMIREHLGGSEGKLEERMEHVRIAALGAVCDARAVFIALRAKGLITEREEQFFLDQGYQAVLAQIEQGMKAMAQHGVMSG
jgi:hypothetical protein